MKKRKVLYLLIFVMTAGIIFLGIRYIRHIIDAAQQDEVVLRFAVSSRSEVDDEENSRLEKFMQSVYSYSEKEKYTGVDGFIINGGLTSKLTAQNMEYVNKICSRILREDTKLLYTYGELDFYNEDEDSIVDQVIYEDENICTNINGYWFILLSPVYNSYESKLKWLSDKLDEVTRYSDKPVFVFQYGAIRDTFYGSETWYCYESDKLLEILERYPTVVDFASSSCTPANVAAGTLKKNATYINTGVLSNTRLNYREFGYDTSESMISGDTKECSQARVVEVYGDNRIVVKTMDVTSGEIYGIAEKSNEIPKSELLKNPKTEYTDTGAYITADRIMEENNILIYGVDVYDNNGNKVYTKGVYSDFMLHTQKNYACIFIPGTIGEGEYIAEITPIDLWGNKIQTLEINLKF